MCHISECLEYLSLIPLLLATSNDYQEMFIEISIFLPEVATPVKVNKYFYECCNHAYECCNHAYEGCNHAYECCNHACEGCNHAYECCNHAYEGCNHAL